MSIATIINFCSHDYPFLASSIAQAKEFSRQIIIPVCDHFYDGVPEDRALLESIYAEHPECQFIEFAYDPDNIYGMQGRRFWHSLARLIGFYFVEPTVEHVLFLDADEIVDSRLFCPWLSQVKEEAIRLACYWYFRETTLRAQSWEDTPLLVRKSSWNAELILHPEEREGGYHAFKGEKRRSVTGLNALPMIHHYSWVRTQEQMLRKASSWGMHDAKDWATLIREEFSRPFNGRDFVHGYTFDRVSSHVEIDLHKKPALAHARPFRCLEAAHVRAIELILRFDL